MPGFDALVKFRCSKSLAGRLARIAAKQRRDLPNLLRMLTEDFVEAEEKKMGLPPPVGSAEETYLLAAETKESEAKPAKPVRYPPHRNSTHK